MILLITSQVQAEEVHENMDITVGQLEEQIAKFEEDLALIKQCEKCEIDYTVADLVGEFLTAIWKKEQLAEVTAKKD